LSPVIVFYIVLVDFLLGTFFHGNFAVVASLPHLLGGLQISSPEASRFDRDLASSYDDLLLRFLYLSLGFTSSFGLLLLAIFRLIQRSKGSQFALLSAVLSHISLFFIHLGLDFIGIIVVLLLGLAQSSIPNFVSLEVALVLALLRHIATPTSHNEEHVDH